MNLAAHTLAAIEERLDLIREYGGFSVWAWANEISEMLLASASESAGPKPDAQERSA